MASSTATRILNFNESRPTNASRPEHWLDDKATGFHNPWPSWRYVGPSEMIKLPFEFIGNSPKIPKDIDNYLPVRSPTWGTSPDRTKIQATWLGHACFFLEMPAPETAVRGARVLFDPVFSDRCSPSQWVGPKRFTKPPCKIEEIPAIDAVVISHNHYDHMDTHTLKTLLKRDPVPHIFAPLGNKAYFEDLGTPKDHLHILDWWESRRLEIDLPAIPTAGSTNTTTTVAVDITCTPAQHFTGRGILDRFKSLWASWAVQAVSDRNLKRHHEGSGVKVWFGGDTGYRAVHPGKKLEELPCCPVFKEIGERFGGFDFAMIPIGAYAPRHFMSPIHCSPTDSVQVFKDIKAKKALGMHWGAWILTTEDIMDPPKHLVEECEKVGIPKGDFTVCNIGETVSFE